MTRPARERSRLRHIPFAAVLLLVAVGFVRIGMYYWREGAGLIGGALLLAAVLRAVLPTEGVGLLALRRKPADVLLYLVFGLLMLAVDLTIVGGPLA